MILMTYQTADGRRLPEFDTINTVLAKDGTIQHAHVRLHVAEVIAGSLGVHAALRSACEAFDQLADAKTLGEQAEAFTALSNAMSDLESWHPEYDWEHGVWLPWPGDEGAEQSGK